jgi:hypothetical protein
MVTIVRKFNKTAKPRALIGGHSYGSEACANTLRQEQDALERDTERAISHARQIIERERIREGER